MAAVARKLRREYDFASATDSRVMQYLNSMPAQLGNNSPQRLGRKLYNNSQKHFIHRTTENLPVGAVYQGDGHTLDVYLQHPVSGKPWRAELVAWMDVRSRYIVGWSITSAESAFGTIQAFGRSLINFDHVPAIVYVDNGSGYKSKMMCDENIGFYQRMGIEPIFAIPGNAKAKGNIERWFRTMERDFNVWWPEAFCGEGMGKEEQARQFNLVQQGKIQLPTLNQWIAKFGDWLEDYHNSPHPELPATTPHQLWQQLAAHRTPVNMTELELNRPQIERVVQRGYVTLHNRKYKNSLLISHNGSTVRCEYDLHTDETITVRDEAGRLICDAALVKKHDYIPTSRLDQALQKSREAALKRLERKADEVRVRTSLVYEHTDSLDALVQFDNELLERDIQKASEPLMINLLDDDYLS
jgi:putative transposase